MKHLLFRLARSPITSFIIGWIFTYMSWSIPVKRLHETDSLMAFHHPSPSYPIHIVIVPKRAYQSLGDVSPDDTDFHRDLFTTVQKLIIDFDLSTGYRLICNGGEFQDVPQLHFHLITN